MYIFKLRCRIFPFVGVTVWEILTFSARPYSNLTPCELLGAVYNGVRLEQPVTCSLDLYNVLLKCECIAFGGIILN